MDHAVGDEGMAVVVEVEAPGFVVPCATTSNFLVVGCSCHTPQLIGVRLFAGRARAGRRASWRECRCSPRASRRVPN